jgi:hypothetical protein
MGVHVAQARTAAGRGKTPLDAGDALPVWTAEDPGAVWTVFSPSVKFEALAGMADSANPLLELLAAADRDSVERDLRTWREQAGQHTLGVPVEQYLLDAMRRL